MVEISASRNSIWKLKNMLSDRDVFLSALRTYGSSLRPVFAVLYLSLMGMSCVYAAMVYMKLRPDLPTGLIFLGIVYGIYIINRFTDMKEDFANDIGRTVLFSKARAFLYAGIGALGLVSAFLILKGKFTQFHVILILLGVCYSVHLVPWYGGAGKGIRFYRLKEIPFVKNLTVSILWGVSVFLIPILFAGIRVEHQVPVLGLISTLCVSSLNNTVFNDVKDVAGDRLTGNNTLPSVFGVGKTYAFLGVVNLLWIALCVAGLAAGRIDLPHFAFFLFMSVVHLAYILPYHLLKIPRTAIELISDSTLILFGAGVALLSVV